MSDKLNIAGNAFVLYGLTFAAGIVAAFRHVTMPQTGAAVAALEPTLGNVLVFVGVFVVFTFVMVRFAHHTAIVLRLFLIFALLAGAQFIFSAWVPFWYSVAFAGAVLVLLRLVPVVGVHDIAIALGIGGIAGLMGLSVTPLMAAVVLSALSLYDIVSVYRTRHMVALANNMLQSGAVFGFLVPANPKGFLMRTSQAIDARQVMMLGSGDIGLPLVLAASAVSTSIGAAVMVAGFSLLGLVLMQWIFMHQKEPLPMAALPPIAMSAVLGYVLAILLGI